MITQCHKKKSCLSQKGDLPSLVVGDIPNNPTSANFSYPCIRIVGVLALKFKILSYFCIIFSFVVILMKNLEIYIMNRYYREKTQDFFRKFPFIFSSRKRCFSQEKRDFNIFQFGKPEIRDPLGHEICR